MRPGFDIARQRTGFPVNLDGEARVMGELHFGVLPGRLPFFLPAGSPLLRPGGGR